MKSSHHHNTSEPSGRAMGHQKKVASSSGSSKAQKSSKKVSPVTHKNNNKLDMGSDTRSNHSSSGSTANSNGPGTATTVSTAEDSSDKNRYKNYAGISARSVKCYWEQYSNANETECQDEVYMRVAEDVTYKLWELGNVSCSVNLHVAERIL